MSDGKEINRHHRIQARITRGCEAVLNLTVALAKITKDEVLAHVGLTAPEAANG